MPQPGDIVGGYRIEGLVAKGGMGLVYRAVQPGLDRVVALKLIAPDLAREPGFRQRFERESRLAASIEHPNVIPVYEAGEDDGRLYLTMRYVDGVDLRTLITQEGGLPPARAAAIVAQVGAALDAAHGRGLVHRDVKPANVLIAREAGGDHAYLTDFGITKDLTTEGITKTGQIVGTVDYIPPEQAEGRRVDARSDVYSLGCVLFHALTGRVPFERPSDVAKIWAHISEAPPAPSDTDPALDPELDVVVRRAMAKEPDERYPAAGDLGTAALAAVEGRAAPGGEGTVATGMAAPLPAEAGAVTRPAPPAGGSPEPTTVAGGPPGGPAGAQAAQTVGAPGPPAAPTRRRRALPIAAGLGAVLVAAVLAVVLLGPGEENDEAPARSAPGAARAPALVERIPLETMPRQMAVGEGFVWTISFDGVVTRIDPKTDKVAGEPLKISRSGGSIAVGEGSVWATGRDLKKSRKSRLFRIDPRLGQVVGEPIEVGARALGIAVGEGAVWVVNGAESTLTKVDPGTGKVVGDPIEVPPRPFGIATGNGYVWISHLPRVLDRGPLPAPLTQIDPSIDMPFGQPTEIPKTPVDVAVKDGFVWVASSFNVLTRFDSKRREKLEKTIDGFGNLTGVATGPDGVFVVGGESGQAKVARVDEGTGAPIGKPVPLGPIGKGGLASAADGEGGLWVALSSERTVVKLDP